MPREIWKPFPGYETWYRISNQGRVMSTRRVKGIIMKLFNNKQGRGYNVFFIVVKGKSKMKGVHRAVAIAFKKNPLNKRCVNHKNGIKTDDRSVNLEWATHSENTRHAFRIGLFKSRKGEANANSRLSNKEVMRIYKSKMKTKDLVIKFGVSISVIQQIKNGYIWESVTGHKFVKGVIPDKNGEKHPNSKLTNSKVKRIYLSNGVQSKIAKKYSVAQSLISLIRTGAIWSHITKDFKAA